MKILVMNCSPVRDGATAWFAGEAAYRFAKPAEGCFSQRNEVKQVCIADYDFNFCQGCKSCYTTGQCVQHDDFDKLMAEIDAADEVVFVVPSYWADVPAQFKAFIDRCTPWCDTHEPHASLREGKTARVILFRTGHGQAELDNLERTMRHFCGHMKMDVRSVMRITGITDRDKAARHWREMEDFCTNI